MNWIECDVAYNRNELRAAGLLEAGTVLKFADGDTILVGDINELGGVCDDCTTFGGDVRIVAHAKISLED